MRNYKWEHSEISIERRAEQYSQKPVLLVFTGEHDVGKKALAKKLEKSLVYGGRYAYYLGIGTFLYGVDSDIKNKANDNKDEHIRRFAEVANLMLDAGMILIVTARSLTQSDYNIMRDVVSADIETIWVGDQITTDLCTDIVMKQSQVSEYETIEMLRNLLKNKGFMFKF